MEKAADATQANTGDTVTFPDAESQRILTGLQDMRCLLSFIDMYIKRKQAYLSSDRCASVAFADLPLLFNPGDLVISRDLKQAYRVTKVTSEGHKIKRPNNYNNYGFTFWNNEAEAEFDDDPVFVHYNHVEFDGTEVGPVLNVTAFPRYEGKSDLRSLDIYPLRHAKDSGLRDRLISRGRLFLKVAGIKHMHYTGLTLGTRDELDSPVVIDFEEAFARYPSWIPRVRHVADEWKLREAEIHRSVPLDEKPLNDWMFYWKNALQLRDSPCIEECCASETTHYDEYVEIERMKDYLNERMKEADSSTPSVSIVPRAFKRINEGIAPTDEDFLIMTFSVFGFALRNRKWCMSLTNTCLVDSTMSLTSTSLDALDITNLSEVAILGEGEGFDQLVLPPGHGNMVKSMIRQHLRDRKLASSKSTKMDVVRGKGMISSTHDCPLVKY